MYLFNNHFSFHQKSFSNIYIFIVIAQDEAVILVESHFFFVLKKYWGHMIMVGEYINPKMCFVTGVCVNWLCTAIRLSIEVSPSGQ